MGPLENSRVGDRAGTMPMSGLVIYVMRSFRNMNFENVFIERKFISLLARSCTH